MANGSYEKLREAILSGRYLPNERLVESDLVASLGEPRAALRTALVRLAHEGLVKHSPNRGAKVRLVTESEAVEIIEARAALEGHAARLAATNRTEQQAAELQAILGQMLARREAGDLPGASEQNARLHAGVLAMSGHATIQRLVASLSSQLVRHQYRTILLPGRAAGSYEEHTEIVAAITAGDPERAESAMRGHLGKVGAALRAASASVPHA